MKTWNICTDGEPYSRVCTSTASTAEEALKQWEIDIPWMRPSLEAAFPGVVITAEPFISSRLDSYGTGRGG